MEEVLFCSGGVRYVRLHERVPPILLALSNDVSCQRKSSTFFNCHGQSLSMKGCYCRWLHCCLGLSWLDMAIRQPPDVAEHVRALERRPWFGGKRLVVPCGTTCSYVVARYLLLVRVFPTGM